MKRQSGQAIIEYMLVLVVVIGIILGLMYQFNSAFRVYVSSFFGGYIACLLETGELPALGANTNSYCAANFAARYDINNGQPSPGGIGNSGGNSGNRGGGNSGRQIPGETNPGANQRNAGSGSNESAAVMQNASRGADGNGSNSGPKTAASLFNSRGRPARTAVGEVAGEEGATYTGSTAPNDRNRSVGQMNSDSGRVDRMTVDRRFFSEKDLAEQSAPNASKAVAVGQGEGDVLRPKRTSIAARRATASVDDDEEEGFSIGKLLRFLLIFIIIGTLVLLIGGQALQISKSWEK